MGWGVKLGSKEKKEDKCVIFKRERGGWGEGGECEPSRRRLLLMTHHRWLPSHGPLALVGIKRKSEWPILILAPKHHQHLYSGTFQDNSEQGTSIQTLFSLFLLSSS